MSPVLVLILRIIGIALPMTAGIMGLLYYLDRRRKLLLAQGKVVSDSDRLKQMLSKLSDARLRLHALKQVISDFSEATNASWMHSYMNRKFHGMLEEEVSRALFIEQMHVPPVDVYDAPLRTWIKRWMTWRGTVQGWGLLDGNDPIVDMNDAFLLALKEQRAIWETEEWRQINDGKRLMEEIQTFEGGVGTDLLLAQIMSRLEPITTTPEETRRKQLKELRVRVAALEGDILQEEDQFAPGPMRRKHGISTDD